VSLIILNENNPFSVATQRRLNRIYMVVALHLPGCIISPLRVRVKTPIEV